MMKKLILLVALATVTVYCEKPATEAPMSTGRAELKALLDGKATVVDVRTPGEFASGHHPRAVNIPVDQVQSRMAEFGDKAKPVVVYCASGARSSRAKQMLLDAGYKDVTNGGGFSNLP